MRIHQDTVEDMASFVANAVKLRASEITADLTDTELDIFYKDMDAFLARLNAWHYLVTDRKEEENERDSGSTQ